MKIEERVRRKEMLNNGYYLSTYIVIDKISFLTDFSLRGDQNISLWKVNGKDVELIHLWELERVTGLKGHDISFMNVESAKEFINNLLAQYDLTLDDMVEVWGTPGLDTSNDYHSLEDYSNISYHSIAHLYSALMLDTARFESSDILALAVDGGPDIVVDKKKDDKPYYSASFSSNGVIKDIFPVHSPGPMWAAARNIFKLREGSLMALESATDCTMKGNPFTYGKADEITSASNVAQEMTDYCNHINELWENDKNEIAENYDERFSAEENKISMIMKEIDRRSLQIITEAIDGAIKKYNIDPSKTYLAMTGGYALNCPANSYFMKAYGFKGFIAPPCVNDCGISMGMALYAFYKKMGQFNFKLKNAFYGDADYVTEDELLEKYGDYIQNISGYSLQDVVEDIERSPIVWFKGGAEIGPRALGHRSILGNPLDIKTKVVLNKMKGRQWWRPVAPIILEEEINEWFEDGHESPYMLHTFKLKEEKREHLSSIEHLDGSCRVQTINQDQEIDLYNLIKEMQRINGVPILCNTSLNDIGEPIINTVKEAINFILRKGIKVAFINQFRIEFVNHNQFKEEKYTVRKYNAIFNWSKEDIEKEMKAENPFDLPKDQLAVYLYSSKLRYKLDLKNEKDVRAIKMLTKHAKKQHPNIPYGGINTGCS